MLFNVRLLVTDRKGTRNINSEKKQFISFWLMRTTV